MKKDNIVTPSEQKIKAETFTELDQIKTEINSLGWDELKILWDYASNLPKFEELIDECIAHFNFQEDEKAEKLGHSFQYDTRNVGRFCYSFTNKQSEKYTEHIEVYRPSILTKFRELTQLIAYEKYGIEKEWKATDELVVPLSACEIGVQLYVS